MTKLVKRKNSKSHPVRHYHHVSRLNIVLLVAVFAIGFMFYVSYAPSNSFIDEDSTIEESSNVVGMPISKGGISIFQKHPPKNLL